MAGAFFRLWEKVELASTTATVTAVGAAAVAAAG
jgi:hypothetical protein